MEFPTRELARFCEQGFDDNSLIMFVVDQTTHQIIDANKKAQSFYQYSLEHFKSIRFNDLCVDDTIDNLDLTQGLNGELERFAVTQRTANGDLRYLEVHVTPIKVDDKHHLFMILIDATERQQTEKQLRDTEARYRIIANFNHDWEYWVTPDGLYGYVSPSCERITGYTADEFMEKPTLLNEIIHPDDQAMWTEFTAGLSSDDGAPRKTIQFRIQHRNGETRWIEHVSQIVIDKNDTYLGHRASNRDITQRKTIEQQLAQNKEWLELAVESAGMAMWEWDITHNHFKYDKSWAELLGYTLDEIQPMDTIWEKLIHPQDKAKAIEMMNRVLGGSIPLYEMEQRLQNKTGEWRWFMSRGTVVEYLPDGRPSRFIGVDVDVTTSKKNQATSFQFELERQRIHVLSTFIQNAKHEFKTPLSRINTKLYLMRHAKDDEKRNTIAESIEHQVEEIDRLVDSMMLMARLDTVSKIVDSQIDLRGVINSLVVDSENVITASNIRLVSDVPQDVPKIHGNTSDLYEAFRRLFDNSIRYTPANGHINVSLKVAKSNVIVEIKDTGTGISEEALPHIFERFFREDQAHTTSGIGLGLPIAKAIIEQHRGDIRVSSTPNIGTTVQVRLPVHPI